MDEWKYRRENLLKGVENIRMVRGNEEEEFYDGNCPICGSKIIHYQTTLYKVKQFKCDNDHHFMENDLGEDDE